MRSLSLVVVAAAFDVAGGSSSSRELHRVDCRANNKRVFIDSGCCEETEQLQKRQTHATTAAGGENTNEKCDQVNMEVFSTNKYCNGLECVYDVWADNPDCAIPTRDNCLARRGKVFASELKYQCDHGKFNVTVKNFLDCLATSCSLHDENILLWSSSRSSGRCQLSKIDGKTRSEKKQEEKFGQIMGGVMVVILIVFYLAIKEYHSDYNNGNDSDSAAQSYEKVSMLEIPDRRTNFQ
jgi:hypothetical protein